MFSETTNPSDLKLREVKCKMGYERSYEMGVVDAKNRTNKERAGKTSVLSDIFFSDDYNQGRADDKQGYRDGWKSAYRK